MGCFQALMGLLLQKWSDINHLYLQYLGAKVTGLRWILSIIRKLWKTLWDTWNHQNHNILIPKGPLKMDLLENINCRVRFNLWRGMSGIPMQYQSPLNKNTHSLLSHLFCQYLSWIMAISSARLWLRQKNHSRLNQQDTDQILITYVIEIRLIPSLTTHPPPPLLVKTLDSLG